METNRKPIFFLAHEYRKKNSLLNITTETIIKPQDKCTTNGDK